MARPIGMDLDNPVPLHTDKIVCRLDLFPEVLQALRDGDVLTGRLFCAQLFDLDGRRNRLGDVNNHPTSRDQSLLRTFPPFV